MKTGRGSINVVVGAAAKVFAVFLAAAALAGYAGPLAIDAHDNGLFWVGVGCFLAAGAVLIFGGLWVAASVRDLFGERNPKA